jgi:hypothetical protein
LVANLDYLIPNTEVAIDECESMIVMMKDYLLQSR